MPDAREREVRGGDPASLPGELREDAFASADGFFGIGIKPNGNFRMIELHGGVVDHVADEHDPLPLRTHRISRAAGRVAGHRLSLEFSKG